VSTTSDRKRRPSAETAHREDTAAFAAALDEEIARQGLSLRGLAKLLGRYGELASSVTTLSEWRRGTTAPPATRLGRNRVLALERCLGLPPGDLVLRLPEKAVTDPRRPPPRRGERRSASVDPLATRYAEHQHRMNRRQGPDQLIPLSVAKEHLLGPTGLARLTMVRMRMRAAVDGVDHYPFVHCDNRRHYARPLAAMGCTIGDDVDDSALAPNSPERLVTTEIRFPTLARGEIHEFAFSITYEASREAERIFRHMQTRPCERLELTLRFDADALPAELTAHTWQHRSLAELHREVVRLDGCSVRLALVDPTLGGHGWRWDWPAHLARLR
jgi:hypothetical protein